MAVSGGGYSFLLLTVVGHEESCPADQKDAQELGKRSRMEKQFLSVCVGTTPREGFPFPIFGAASLICAETW